MRNVPQYVWKSTACAIDVMCFWCSPPTAVRGGAATSDVVDDATAAHTATRKYHPSRSPIISPHLQAAQQDATADIANNLLLARRPKTKQLHHQAAQQGATARCKTAKCKYLVAVM